MNASPNDRIAPARTAGRRLSDDDLGRIRAMAADGIAPADIAIAIGCSLRAVTRRVRQFRLGNATATDGLAKRDLSSLRIVRLCLVGGCFSAAPVGGKYCDRHKPAASNFAAMRGR